VGGDEATAGARGTGPEPGGGPPDGAEPQQRDVGAGAPDGARAPRDVPSRVAAGTALAGVAVAGTALAAVLLRPSHTLLGRSSGPLDTTLAVVLIALLALGGMLVLSARYRNTVGYQQNLPPFEQRLSDATRLAMIAAALVIPAMLLAMHSFPSVDNDDSSAEYVPDPTGSFHTLPVRTPAKTGKPHDGPSLTLPHWLVYVGVAALLVVLLLAGYQLWRLLRPAAGTQTAGTYSGMQDEQEVLADAVDSGRRALLLGNDPRAAVIACYAAMEASLAGSGVARRASDSPQDLLERASTGGLLDGPHAEDLTRLFREARYSTHPMDAGHRDRAAAALDAIAAQLAARAAERAAREAEPAAAQAAQEAGRTGQDGRGPQQSKGVRR
jgi:uncharacterized protein DUF4129